MAYTTTALKTVGWWQRLGASRCRGARGSQPAPCPIPWPRCRHCGGAGQSGREIVKRPTSKATKAIARPCRWPLARSALDDRHVCAMLGLRRSTCRTGAVRCQAPPNLVPGACHLVDHHHQRTALQGQDVLVVGRLRLGMLAGLFGFLVSVLMIRPRPMNAHGPRSPVHRHVP